MTGYMCRKMVFLVALAGCALCWAQDTESNAAEAETPPAKPEGKVMIIRLSDEGKYMVDQVQAEFIIDSLERAKEGGFGRVVLKIDTFGGVVFSAREITEALVRLDIPTTAFVETKAISAGVFISWACDEIVMEEHTTLGDAQMIMQTMEGKIEEAPEKAVSVYRSDWKKSSDAKGRSFALAQGFFDAEAEVLRVGTEDTWEFVLREDYELLDESAKKPILQVVSKKGQLLTLTAEEAKELGIARVVPNFEAYLASVEATDANTEEVTMTFNQQILRYLGANTWIFFILTLIGLNGLYMEIKAPGFGIPGLTAIVCFTLVFGSRYFLGTADAFEMVLFLAGVALCLAEIFVIPGFGVVGITGLVAMFGALILASLPDFGGLPQNEFQWDWVNNLLVVTTVSFVMSIATLIFLVPLVFKLPFTQRNMLPNEFKADQGWVMKTVSEEDDLVGKTGITQGGLRPSGKVLFDDGRFLDVVTEGVFVDNGARVKVSSIDGNRIVVRPLAGQQARS